MANWIPTGELTDVDLHDIKLLKESRDKRGNEGVLKMLYVTEQKVDKVLRTATNDQQLHQAQGIAQFFEELSELIDLK
jgi:hypothetical protein